MIFRARHRRRLFLLSRQPHSLSLVLACLLSASYALANSGFLQIRNGYFWDPAKAEYFVPRGMAYQTFNPPVGANQTFEQLDYDLRECKKFYANSIRCEMVWNEVERSQGAFDWSRPDALVAKAEELDLKLFVLIGFQYAPAWFPEEWRALNNAGQRSVVLAYEHPQARVAYSNFIYTITTRYRNSTAIGAWILGNEYAYFDLWETNRLHLGYDEFSSARFRQYLSTLYSNNIAALNANWQTNHSNFDTIEMPRYYPTNRFYPAYYDLIQWRKASIGEYVALGARACKLGDPNHLRTYSMVGGLFGEADIHFTCEDAKTIVASCATAGAPLDFWAINNYAIASLVNELRSADFGIAKHQAASGLPVMISETGHTSTENLYEGASARQAAALPGQMWEALISGAIGTHIFTWNDRDLFSGENFPREKGFGIVHQSRLVKDPVYWNVAEMFRRMEQLNISRLLGGSTNPAPDMQFFWTQVSDMGWPRANHENIRLWSTLKRLGYQPGIIDDEQFERGDYRNARALVLSRAFQMNPRHLEILATNVIPAGIHVHACTDLPGHYNAYRQVNPTWVSRMSSVFGLNVANANALWDAGSVDPNPNNFFAVLELDGVRNFAPFPSGYFDAVGTWKIWHGISASSGGTIITHRGLGSSNTFPALQIKTNGTARTAINTFALGDISILQGHPPTFAWDFRYKWLQAIYRTHFGLVPPIDLSGTGAQYVFPDYRTLKNGTVLISLLNGHTNPAAITLTAPTLMSGRTVENLTSGGIVEANSDGVINLNLAGDQYVLLYTYNPASSTANSLITTNRNKLWFADAPNAVWPDGTSKTVTLGYDTVTPGLQLVVEFQRRMAGPKTYGRSTPVTIPDQTSTISVDVPVPDADLNDVDHLSSLQNANYEWRAWFELNGTRVSEVSLPVQMLWGVRPDSLPAAVVPGNTYPLTLRWQDVPSYEPAEVPTTLRRADLWDPLRANYLFYNVILELRNDSGTVASDSFLTSTGSDSHTFSLTVPSGATGPFRWWAGLRPVPNVSRDVIDSFEDRATGATTNSTLPWNSYVYSQSNTAQWFAEGVYTVAATDGAQGAFIIVTNPPNSGSFAGFGFYYNFPQPWSLPANVSDWASYSFAADFREETSDPCLLELQLKDVRGGTLTFSKTYTPGANRWDTISGALDQFTVSPNVGYFDPARVSSLFLNVQMRRSNATYFATFDRVRFNGPEQIPIPGSPADLHDSFEDREGGEGADKIQPWDAFTYSEIALSNLFLNVGVQRVPTTHGGQSVFMVVTNPAAVGAFSGFLMIRAFPQTWALPEDPAERAGYSFTFDFRENANRACLLELQLKDSAGGLLHYTNAYVPGAGGWQTVGATLDQFRKPSWFPGEFNYNSVKELVVIAQMLEKNRLYIGSFDNIRIFGPPGTPVPEPVKALYLSENDSGEDSDGDAIPDAHETDTGVYVSPTNTGTSPTNRDSDGDGVSDRDELVAGTNPNLAADVLRISGITRNAAQSTLSWNARSNRIYTVHFLDGGLRSDVEFCPVENLTTIPSRSNAVMQATDPTAAGSPVRNYRISVRQP